MTSSSLSSGLPQSKYWEFFRKGWTDPPSPPENEVFAESRKNFAEIVFSLFYGVQKKYLAYFHLDTPKTGLITKFCLGRIRLFPISEGGSGGTHILSPRRVKHFSVGELDIYTLSNVFHYWRNLLKCIMINLFQARIVE